MWKVGLLLSCAMATFSTAGGGRRGGGSSDDGSSALQAAMTCDRVDGPGRVRCDVEARVAPQESIAWGDVIIVRTPPFAAALRGRIGPHDATMREVSTWRWALALVARGTGQGDIEARVRLVVCRDGRCSPRQATVSGRVAVGD